MNDALSSLIALGLMAGLAPLWLLAGWADWACHRHLRIEHSAGVRESWLHLAMLAELGLGLLAALLLTLNAGSLVLMAAACVAHEVTVWVDLAYAESRRRIPWFEQWVHGLQQALPWVGLAGLALLVPAQALSVFGVGEAPPDWSLRWKQPALPPMYVAGLLLAALLLVVAPFVGELLRALRAAKAPRSVA